LGQGVPAVISGWKRKSLKLLAIGFVVFSVSAHSLPPPTQKSNSIRVRISRGVTSTWIHGKSIKILAGDQSYDLPSNAKGFQLERVKSSKGFWAWKVSGEPGGNFEKIKFQSTGLLLVGEELSLGNTPIPPVVHVRSTENPQTFDMVVNLDLENYLMGVLPKEMPLSWPLEALKAQAVAARSYALFQKEKRKTKSFDVEATTLDQVYEYKSHVEDRWTRKLKGVLNQTKGLVMSKGVHAIKAYFHADCGGSTELASNVWGEKTNFNGQISSCNHGASHPWRYEINKTSLGQRALEFMSLPLTYGKLVTLEVIEKSSSGRVHQLRLKYSEGNQLDLSSQTLREIVGFTKVKSTHFQIQQNEELVSFEGEGRGHGVGMCQVGAKYLAKRGVTFKEILKKYYPNTDLKILKL
tara:strand:+ start:5443 stop:6669 length:1227 start_codon:yes stop_codon:yes gene_type:complete